MALNTFHSHEEDPMAEINMTPLVDVMLVLLIVFMVTMPILTHSIPLSLPSASEEAIKHQNEIKDPLRLAINLDGIYELNGKIISVDDLKMRLQEAVQLNPELILAIAADKATKYQMITEVLGLAQDLGIRKVGFTTEVPALLSK